MFTETNQQTVMANAPIFLKYSYTIDGQVGGGSQYWYSKLEKETGCTSAGQVLKGLGAKLTNSKKRARLMGWRYDLDLRYMAKIWLAQQGECCVTGVLMNFDSGNNDVRNHLACSIDRLNSNHGYIKGNVRLLTHWANNAINTWDDQLFEQMVLQTSQKLQRGVDTL